MSRIKSVTVRRFKQLQELQIDLADTTLFIGANNSGKSSFLQAIHLAVAVAQTAKLVGEGINWQNDAFQLSLNPSQLLYSPVADVAALATGGELRERQDTRIEIQLIDADDNACTVALKKGRNRNVSVVIEGRTLGERLMDMNQPFTVYAPGLAGIQKEERYLSPGALRRIVARGDANLVLRNVLYQLHKREEPWSRFVTDMQSIFPGIEIQVSFNEDVDELIEVYFQMPGGPSLPVDAAGTSILQASQILGYVSLFQPQVLILDEPDSHLHPNNQRNLCNLIYRLVEERGFQTVISTHSRHVLNAMHNKSTVVWLNKGTRIAEKDATTTSLLMDLGALDSADYFADGQLKCVVATEDTDAEPIRSLLLSNGFLEEDTEIASYDGCSKVEAAIVLSSFLKDRAPNLNLVIHRDQDYGSIAQNEKFNDRLVARGVDPFLTEFSDIEGYFLNAQHLNYLNPMLSVERARELISAAISATREASIKAIINCRTQEAYRLRAESGASVNAGEIAIQSTRDYDANPSQLCRGKEVLGHLKGLIQSTIGTNPKIFYASPYLISTSLQQTAAEIWAPEPIAASA